MERLVKFSARPKLNSPNMLAAWPGIGNVSMLVATYLKNKLDFKELGEIDRFIQELEEVILGDYPIVNMVAVEGKLA